MPTLVDAGRFLTIDDAGAIAGGLDGAWSRDRRVVSRLVVTIDGEQVQPADEAGGHALRWSSPVALTHDAATLTWTIDSDGWVLAIDVSPAAGVDLELAFDGTDVFAAKHAAALAHVDDTGTLGVDDDEVTATGRATTVVTGDRASVQATLAADHACGAWFDPLPDVLEVDGDGLVRVRWGGARPRSSSTISVAIVDCDGPTLIEPSTSPTQRCSAADRRNRSWIDSAPRLTSPDPGLVTTWVRTLEDLGSLALPTVDGEVTAAGAPWFLTLFGRDAIITALQTLPTHPDRAVATLRHLARLQATVDDATTDAEPGKIVHELRSSTLAERWHRAYYGTADATPLWLLLLAEASAWRGDEVLLHELRTNAESALTWITRHAPRIEGLVAWHRRAARGLDNQSWKDSWDSQRTTGGEVLRGGIAALEVQYYCIAALERFARIADEVWGDRPRSVTLLDAARDLRRATERLWCTGGGDDTGDFRTAGWWAMGIDEHGVLADALGSNVGHLLWVDDVESPRAAATAAQLASPLMSSGWGVRTLAADEAGYSPLSYHCGTVWPHDSAICVAGLARAGRLHDAAEIARGLLDAAAHDGGRLPEVIAGFERVTGVPPVRYPATCSPQAWAAGAVVQVIVSLLGLEPDAEAGVLHGRSHDVPDWLEGTTITGLHALGRRWDVRVRDGACAVSRGAQPA